MSRWAHVASHKISIAFPKSVMRACKHCILAYAGIKLTRFLTFGIRIKTAHPSEYFVSAAESNTRTHRTAIFKLRYLQ